LLEEKSKQAQNHYGSCHCNVSDVRGIKNNEIPPGKINKNEARRRVILAVICLVSLTAPVKNRQGKDVKRKITLNQLYMIYR